MKKPSKPLTLGRLSQYYSYMKLSCDNTRAKIYLLGTLSPDNIRPTICTVFSQSFYLSHRKGYPQISTIDKDSHLFPYNKRLLFQSLNLLPSNYDYQSRTSAKKKAFLPSQVDPLLEMSAKVSLQNLCEKASWMQIQHFKRQLID